MNIFLIQNLNGMDVFFRIVQILFVLFITILVFNEITILKGFILVILLYYIIHFRHLFTKNIIHHVIIIKLIRINLINAKNYL